MNPYRLIYFLFGTFALVAISFGQDENSTEDTNDSVTSDGSTTCHNGKNGPDNTGGGCDWGGSEQEAQSESNQGEDGNEATSCAVDPSATAGNSLIANGNLTYHKYIDDYVQPSGSSSCGSCVTSAGGASDLPSLRIRRQFRSRVDYAGRTGSLGRNAGLADYERHLLFPSGTYGVSYGNVARILQGRGMWYGAGRQAWVTNNRDKGFFGLFLYNNQGVLITDKTQRDSAHSAVLMHHDGSSEHFEVIWDRHGKGEGRLVALADRNGNSVNIDYVKPQPTWKVWWFGEFFRIKSITDAHNRCLLYTSPSPRD